MITPSDNQISDLCAEACGYTIERGVMEYDGSQLPWRTWKKDGADYNPKPFCTDRNLLTELWEEARKHNIYHYKMMWYLRKQECLCDSTVYEMLTASPREVAIAFLRTMNQWPSDWQVEP